MRHLRASLKPDHVALLILFILAVVLRTAVFTQSLWNDEILTARVSEVGAADFMQEMAAHNMSRPPLYYFLSYVAVRVFPQDWGSRVPALMFGLATLPVFWLFARRIVDRTTALFATFLLVISPLSAGYSEEAREYSLLGFACLLALYGLWAALQENKRSWWVVFFVGTALSIQASFFGFLSVFAQGLFLVLVLSAKAVREKPRLRQLAVPVLYFLSGIVLSLLLFLPWKSIFLSFLAGEGAFSTNKITGPVVFDALFFWRLLMTFGWGSGRGAWFCAIGLGAGLVAAALDRRLLVWLGVSQFLGALLPFGVILHFTRMAIFEPRYIIFVLPAMVLLVAKGLAALAGLVEAIVVKVTRRRTPHPNVVGIAIAYSLALWACWPSLCGLFVQTKENWRDTCAFIARHGQANDAVIIQPPWAQYTIEFYGNDLPPVYAFYANDLKRLNVVCRDHARVWFVGRWGTKKPPLDAEMPQRGFIPIFDPWAQGLHLEIRDSALDDTTRHAAAIQWRSRARQEIRYHPLMDAWLARAYRDAQDPDRARLYFERAAAAVADYLPADPSYRWAHARLLKEMGEFDRARRSYLTYLRLDPWCSTAALELAQLLAENHRPEEAIPYFKRCMQLDPSSEEYVLRPLAQMYERSGNVEQAIQYYERCMERNPDNAAFVLFDLAQLYEQAGNIDAAFNALKTLSQRLKETSSAPPYHWAVGARVLAHYGRIDQAINEFHAILAEAPTYGNAYYYFADALIEAGRVDEARDVVRTGLAQEPDNANLLKLKRNVENGSPGETRPPSP
jgi:tetratricopeptide (TPR) repeat protein